MSLDTMKQALEALEKSVSTCFDRYAHEQVMSRPEHFINQTITALRLAIEQAEKQKPVAWTRKSELARAKNLPAGYACAFWGQRIDRWVEKNQEPADVPLYTAPPQRQPLTEGEILDLWKQVYEPGHQLHVLANAITRAIERKHGIGGGE